MSALAPTSDTPAPHDSRTSDDEMDTDNNVDWSFAIPVRAQQAQLNDLAAGTELQKKSSSAAPSAAASAAPVTRWPALYDDALHSILKFASLLDLARLMSVSRRWSEAVLSSPPIAAPLLLRDSEHLSRMLSSRLRRHLSALRSVDGRCYQIESIAELELVSSQVPWLRELDVAPRKQFAVDELCAALSRFDQLRRLILALPASPVTACNRIVETVSLHSAALHELDLNLPQHSADFSFAPLAGLKQLWIFRFVFRDGFAELTDAQMDQLRSLSSLRQLTRPDLAVHENTEFLVRLLQPGHSLRLTSLGGLIRVTESLAAVLGSLPSLTSLAAGLVRADVRFLSQLHALTSIDLIGTAPDAAELVAALRHRSLITRLKLSRFALTGRQLEELLPALPRLSDVQLEMLPQLDSLRCFATPALAASLTELSLWSLPMCPPTEIAHLFGLRSLSALFIRGLTSPLSAEQKAELSVGSSRFPALTRSKCV